MVVNAGAMIVKWLVGAAVVSHNQKVKEQWREKAIAVVEQYYMSYFGGFLQNERNWIYKAKIKPMVANMNDKQLGDILMIKEKNDKRIKKNKPVKVILVDKETIERYHADYQSALKRAKKQREAQEAARAEEAKKKKQRAQDNKKYKEYVYEHGESDAEIARKLF